MYTAYWMNVTALLLVAVTVGFVAPARLRWVAAAVVAAGGLILLFPASCWSPPSVVPLTYTCPRETRICSTLLDVNTPPFGSQGRLGPVIAAAVIGILAAAVTLALSWRLRIRANRD